MSDAALDALRLYDWPGNVRELERLAPRVIAPRDRVASRERADDFVSASPFAQGL